MAWTPPTIDDFKARYPEFTIASDTFMQLILNESIDEVGDTWVERDRTPAILALTAHFLAAQGQGVAGVGPGGGGASSTGTLKSYTVGDVSATFSGIDTGSAEALIGFKSTAYGQEYLRRMRRNFPAVAVV